MKKRQLVLSLLVVIVGGVIAWRFIESSPSDSDDEKPDSGEQTGAAKPTMDADKNEDANKGVTVVGKVTLTETQRQNANLIIAKAGPMKIRRMVPLYGKIAVNEEHVESITPRFPGIVKTVTKQLGNKVEKGDVLATVESNDSLRTYDIVSEIAGTVIQKEVIPGEYVRDDKPIFVVADLSTVWVDLNVYRQDFALLREGQPVWVGADEGTETIQSTIAYLSPAGVENTQSMLARAVIPNPEGDLRPGLFVSAQVLTGEVEVPVAVKSSSLQTINEKSVVFVREGDSYEAREVKIGKQDSEFVEVVSGLMPGDEYVAGNSFVLKAELGKSEAKDTD